MLVLCYTVGAGLKVFSGQGKDSSPGPTHTLSRGALLSLTPGLISAEALQGQISGSRQTRQFATGFRILNLAASAYPRSSAFPRHRNLGQHSSLMRAGSTQQPDEGWGHVSECLWSQWLFISSD